jgi:hypothetical protein
MTLPEQSDRAVAQTREFLVRLASPYVEGGIKGIRREVRAEALALLRHYPYSYRESDEKRGNGDMSGAWIPVSERLPEEDQDVVVHTEDGTHVAAIDEDGVWYPSHGDGWMFPIVSHWMPLPSPPEVTP